MKLQESIIIAEHYKLLKQLGRGSFGEVWLAHNLLADIDVAIKFYGAFDMKGLDEFRTEFKLAYKLHHPNLLNISHFDVSDNCPYLVMPYCANGSVSQQVGRMAEADIWKFASDVANGLSFLHNQQPPIIHQDIKPDNILITADGRYVISDFGISRNLRTKMSATSNTGSSGTIAYMGPERFSEKPVIVLASDIWALGMTLYELMYGDVMWEGMGGCVQLNGARVPAMDQRYSPELKQLVTACLAPQTWDRPTAEQIYAYADARLQNKPLTPLTNHPVSPITIPQKPQPVTPATVAPQQQSVTSTTVAPQQQHASSVANSTQPNSHNSYRQPTPSATGASDSLLPAWLTWKHMAAGVGALLAVAILAGGISTFASSILEEKRFVSCQSVEDYEQFIANYPKSTYVETARKRIADLKPAENEGNALLDTKQQQATTPTTPEATAPVQEHVEIKTTTAFPARSNASTIHRQTSRSAEANADDAAFYSSVTSRDFHNYLTRFPNGRHREAATRALTNLLKSEGGTVIPTNNVSSRPVSSSPSRPPRHGRGMRPGSGFRNHRPRR